MGKIILTIFFIILCLFSYGQNNNIQRQPILKKGVLNNGLTYYLCYNPASVDKIDFQLIQKVGAIYENDDQNGLSHFLEHMCFKGTKNFPARTIPDLFEEKELSESINAYTGMEETIYSLQNIPVNDKSFLYNCMLILHDWCNSLSLTDEAIETERPVIIEELKMRHDFQMEISEQVRPVIYNNSKHSKRYIFGTADIIENFKKETLVEYYKKYFRPERQALVIIGDINIDEYENKIKEIFRDIPKRDESFYDLSFTINDNDSVLFKHVEHKEVNYEKYSIKFRHNHNVYRENYFLVELLNMILEDKKKEILGLNKNILNLGINYSRISKDYGSYDLTVVCKPHSGAEALKTILGVHKHFLENGFSRLDVNRAINALGIKLKKFQDYESKLSNLYYFEKIKDNFLDKKTIYNAQQDLNRYCKFLDKLKPSDFISILNKLYSGKNKCIVALNNLKEEETLSKDYILNIEKQCDAINLFTTAKRDAAPKVKQNVIRKIEKIDPKGQKLVKIEKLNIQKAEKWTLKNGAKVVYSKCNNKGNIELIGISPGGKSVLEGEKLRKSKYFSVLNNCLSLKGVDFSDYFAFLKAYHINYGVSLLDNKEKFIMKCDSKRNLEPMFKLFYSHFSKPYFCKELFVSQVKKNRQKLNKNYKSILNDSLVKFISANYAYDNVDLSLNDFDLMKSIYTERFSNANDFTFYIIGDVEKNIAKSLAEKYLGAIKSNGAVERVEIDELKAFEAYSKKVLEFDMTQEKAGNICLISKKMKYDLKHIISSGIVKLFLEHKLNKYLREDRSGTYKVTVNNYINISDRNITRYIIEYECNPDRLDELNSELQNKLKEYSKIGFTEKELSVFRKKATQNLINESNSTPISNKIIEYNEKGIDLYDIGIIKLEQNSINLDYINSFLREVLSKSRILDIHYFSSK